MPTEHDAFSFIGRSSSGRFSGKSKVNVLLKVEEGPGRVKEERQSRKGENSQRREEGKEEAITIVGATDMQVLSGIR